MGNSNINPGTAGGSHSADPVKKNCFLNRETSVDVPEDRNKADKKDGSDRPRLRRTAFRLEDRQELEGSGGL